MKHMRAIVALGVTLPILSACYASNVDTLDETAATGSNFSRSLSEEYRQLAHYERDEMYDWRDATHYGDKGIRAASGEEIMPDEVETRRLPSDKASEIHAARTDFVRLLGDGAGREQPRLASRAQARLDCWMEQQEEGHQPAHIARCRDGFYGTMAELRAAMQPVPAAAAPAPEVNEPDEPQRFTIYFGFDRDDVTPEDAVELDSIAEMARETRNLGLAVTGYTDSVGSQAYNQALSLRRAERVREVLIDMGVDGDRMSIAARGETEQEVITGDNIAEARNRRVVLLVQ